MKATLFARNKHSELWERGGELYRVAIGSPKDGDGTPQGMRWECSVSHYEYFADVMEDHYGYERLAGHPVKA